MEWNPLWMAESIRQSKLDRAIGMKLSGHTPTSGLTRVGFLERSAWEADGEASHMVSFPSAFQAPPKAFVPKSPPQGDRLTITHISGKLERGEDESHV